MGPRKRSRPNPTGQEATKVDREEQAKPTSQSAVGGVGNAAAVISKATADPPNAPDPPDVLDEIDAARSSRGWYGGGTWPRIQKSTPSTKVARETILAAKSTNTAQSADFSRFEPKKVEDAVSAQPNAARPSSMDPGKGKKTVDVTVSDGKPTTTIKTAANVTDSPNLQPEERPDTHQQIVKETPKITQDDNPTTKDPVGATASGSAPPPTLQRPVITAELSGSNGDSQRPATSSLWQGWWVSAEKTSESSQIPTSHPSKDESGQKENQNAPKSVSHGPLLTEPGGAVDPVSSITSSWFRIWPSSTAPKTSEVVPNTLEAPRDVQPEMPSDNQTSLPASGSSWAFWSRQPARTDVTRTGTEEPGELAVIGEASQDQPTPATTTTPKDPRLESVKQGKRGRQFLSDIEDTSQKVEKPDLKSSPSQSPAPSKPAAPNLLLPSFGRTYRLMENPSIIQQIARLLMNTKQLPANHVFLIKEPPKIRKALAVGIHGMFPAAFLRTVIGQPTGTSIRFANHAAAAIQRWVDKHNFVCDIEKIALEGEGKIAERVDSLWRLLLNWIDHVRKADFILVACHSQGVPVALMLIAKLIEFGVVSSARIGICAMAGVSLGPFVEYKSRIFSGSAAELFDFAISSSEVSRRYEDSLRIALKYGVRVTYVGSIDDQLVSLESAIFSPVNHPYIYRAVFVDGRVHAPDFIAHLVGFALKLRNIGVSDHGLIRELSAPLAGSLYTGEGHSRLYDEEKIYDLSISFALETSSVGDVPLVVQKYDAPTSANPFQLPWSMRGLLEEDVVKTELTQETTELLQQFDLWKPTTKVLKDVKYRLEAVKSKL